MEDSTTGRGPEASQGQREGAEAAVHAAGSAQSALSNLQATVRAGHQQPSPSCLREHSMVGRTEP